MNLNDEEVTRVFRLIVPVSAVPVLPQETDDDVPVAAVPKPCGRCGEDGWYNTLQPNPYPQLTEELICVGCALKDDALRDEVLQMALDVLGARNWAHE